MEIIKRKLCIEDFINRYNVLNGNSQSEWGKILDDVIIEGDLMDIGLYYEEYIPDEGEIINASEWSDNELSRDNIGKIYKKNDSYVQVKNINIIPFSLNNGEKIIRNKVLLKLYRFLINFEYSLVYYIKCGNRWVELNEKYSQENNIVINDFFNDSELINVNTPIIYEISDIEMDGYNLVCKSQYANEFNSIFRINKKHRYEVLLKNVIEKFLSGEFSIDNKTTKPYIDFLISIQQDINSLGIYENNIKQFTNEKYYIGDSVYKFDESKLVTLIYKLLRGNNIEYNIINEKLLRQIDKKNYSIEDKGDFEKKINEFDEKKYDENVLYDNNLRIIVKDGDKYFFPNVIYTASNIDDFENYWGGNNYTNNDNGSNINDNVYCVTDSKLQTIRRSKKSCDEDGNILPFIVKEYVLNEGDNKNTTELLYSLGVSNFYSGTNDNCNTYVDFLKKVEVKYDSIEEKLTWEYVKNGSDYSVKKTITTTNGSTTEKVEESNISVNEIDSSDNTSNSDSGIITFEYVLGALLLSGNTIDENSGIKYKESYNFTVKEELFNFIDNTNNTDYEYKEIEYEENGNIKIEIKKDEYKKNENVGKIYKLDVKDSDDKITTTYYQLLAKYKYIDIDYENAILDNNKKILTSASFNKELTHEDNFFETNIFKWDVTNDIEEVNMTIDLNVERGISAAFERHHILFEINSIADLENYRNNMFKL